MNKPISPENINSISTCINTQKKEGKFAPMNEANKAFLKATVGMYDALEVEQPFGSKSIFIDIPGLPHFEVDPGVYSPGQVDVSKVWPEHLATLTKGKSFLDLGTGTGISALYVALHGEPSRVVATDISPMAVDNCKANAEQYGLKEPFFTTIESDVFESVPEEKFDIMFWNFPWNAPDQEIEEILASEGREIKPEKVIQLKAGLDPEYKALRRFIEQGKERLNLGGEILLGAGAPCRHDIIYAAAEEYGYNIEITEEKEVDVDIINMPKLKVILYKLTPKEEI